jgi:hypothetical protein
MPEAKSLRDRFYDSVHKEPDDHGHWVWLGRRMEDAWGPRCVFDLGTNRPGNNKIIIASRFAYEDAHGVSLKGQKLKRLCSNKYCVNPAHHTPWLNAKEDRRKLLALATTGEERAQQKDSQKRQEKKAPYLAMHWAKGIARELVKQRALLISVVESNQRLIAELALYRTTAELAHVRKTQAEPCSDPQPATDHHNGPLVDVFLRAVQRASVVPSDEDVLASVLDRAIELRIGDDGGAKEATSLFKSWLKQFSLECANGDRAPNTASFVEAVDYYVSSVFGPDGLGPDGSGTSPMS